MFNGILTQTLVSACAMAVLFGCSAGHVSQATAMSESPVAIYVSNQTAEVNPVNIKVSIDQKAILNQNFPCGSGHNWSRFKVSLKEGRHQLVVTSSNGDAGLDVVFTVDKPMWLVIDYWGKNHFQLVISHEPVGFA